MKKVTFCDRYTKTNCSQFDNWLKKLIYIISATGIGTIISLPVLSQSYYPPMVFFQPLAYPNYPQRNKQGNLVNGLKSNTNLKNLVTEIEAAGLTKKLQQEQFTVLAPSDNAFNALPDEVFDKFSEPENRLKVLQYHLIPGKVTEEELNKGKITTLAGDTLTVSKDRNTNTLRLNNAQATFPPTIVKNGVIIEIDQVLLPPGF